MRKVGKVCWWILKAYFKFVNVFWVLLGVGTYLYYVSKTNLNHKKKFGEGLKIVMDVFHRQCDKANFGFKWMYYCSKYKIKGFIKS